MKGILSRFQWFLSVFLVASFISWTLLSSGAHAQNLADGTYTIQYTVLHADNDSASMANDYWEKPARLTVNGGNMTMQMTINHSSWVTEFKVPSNGGFRDVTVVSTDEAADKRVVEFPISDLSTPLESKIHVTVEDIDYDHDYTIRLSFDTSSIQEVNVASTNDEKQEENGTSTKDSNKNDTTDTKKTDNPQTGDTDIVLWGAVLVVALSALIFTRFKWQSQ
ncbi:heme uptake protein IsdC [Halalkalibacterium halodurans]|jgi:heme uptake protein IsdC|uniref:heme uptake protein IsdC n=1 Tax=Halalkalibacterium halodurans TaxID=86665 RepID=UPI002E1F5E41|nr:heme uptake protein IsdC [Halalkalibacterium halodurans]MED4163046.1 heme uptake protein IsdC [Halalkalibacterium halodurans]